MRFNNGKLRKGARGAALCQGRRRHRAPAAVPSPRNGSPRCRGGQPSWKTHRTSLSAAQKQVTSKPGAREVLAPHPATPASPSFVTALARGSRSLSKNPGPPATGERRKNKTQECCSSWPGEPRASFQRIYGILKFSPSAQHFSKTKHLHPFSAGLGLRRGSARPRQRRCIFLLAKPARRPRAGSAGGGGKRAACFEQPPSFTRYF